MRVVLCPFISSIWENPFNWSRNITNSGWMVVPTFCFFRQPSVGESVSVLLPPKDIVFIRTLMKLKKGAQLFGKWKTQKSTELGISCSRIRKIMKKKEREPTWLRKLKNKIKKKGKIQWWRWEKMANWHSYHFNSLQIASPKAYKHPYLIVALRFS